MIFGTVSADGIPVVTLSIAGQDWPAIVDTRFNGDLELPENLREVLNPRQVGRVTSALAGGQTTEEDVYIVDLPFDGRIIRAEAPFVSGAQILIGTHLIREYLLQIDFIEQSVRLECRS